jgi:hypothetical protein
MKPDAMNGVPTRGGWRTVVRPYITRLNCRNHTGIIIQTIGCNGRLFVGDYRLLSFDPQVIISALAKNAL